ncbi:nuclear transport factor 2 family protein [Exilibacterium tricleocarpae]|uniref:Nuclear transport factor 2 family protein n=1 Tax=Exilibacterium tricleocarpae TaxID=2591008 RepID=A0A545TLU1_9GAMM|nr:nuclear transport factor 2 family protein [Exilibacterium tricleocarpae]TQV78189.1 nuclear transport factor 2 family protein [Exilibacterium tricleocarpae]
MFRILLLVFSVVNSPVVVADGSRDVEFIERAVLDYIEAQHKVKPELIVRGLDKKLVKRTYWLDKEGSEFILETNYGDMVKLAGSYNKDGTKFPKNPRVEISILDIDKRTASVKLTVDDWIDYMHLYKNKDSEWKVINVLWQYHDINRHSSKK